MSPSMHKTQIRQFCLARRRQLSQSRIDEASQRIIINIQTLPVYQQAEHIAWYYPIHGEVDLSVLWTKALATHKHCYFPVMQPEGALLFLPYTAQTYLVPNQYQILEPHLDPSKARSHDELDLIFLPVVAFDKQGTRLGMGKGYYDKTLLQVTHPSFICVAYDWQEQERIPKEPWDITLDLIITESHIYSVHAKNRA